MYENHPMAEIRRLNPFFACLLWVILFFASTAPMPASSVEIGADSPQILSTIIAHVPMLVAVPRRITPQTPLIILYHGFGPPNTPELLAKALPPIPDALTVYPSIPLVGTRTPPGGVDELIRRQKADYIGQLLFPSMSGAARELPQIIKDLSKIYGLPKTARVVLFGFSAGGAAALLSLTETDVQPRAVVVVNAPLSIAQAAESYERQSKSTYIWTKDAKQAAFRYDIEKNADRIAQSNRKTAILILESERDAGPTVPAAQAAAAALEKAALAYNPDPDIGVEVLLGSDHSVLSGSQVSTVRPMILAWIARHAFSTTGNKQ
jgi:predicted esterase